MGDCRGTLRPSSDALEAAFLDARVYVASPEVAESTRRFLRKLLNGEIPLERPIRVETSSPT